MLSNKDITSKSFVVLLMWVKMSCLYAGNCIPFSKWTESVIKLVSAGLLYCSIYSICIICRGVLDKVNTIFSGAVVTCIRHYFITWWTLSLISVLCTYSLKAVRKGIEDSAAAAVTNLGDASRDITDTADV